MTKDIVVVIGSGDIGAAIARRQGFGKTILAGLSPNTAPPSRVLAVDLYGAAAMFEELERVIAPGGAGLIISSMAGQMLPALAPEQDHAPFAPAEELLKLPFLAAGVVPNSMVAYMLAKRPPSSAGGGGEVGRARRTRQLQQSWNCRDPSGPA